MKFILLFAFSLIISNSILSQNNQSSTENFSDENYKSFIDSIHKLDQAVRFDRRVRKGAKYVRKVERNEIKKVKQKKLDKSLVLFNSWLEIDSLNSLTLIRKIRKDGFPSKAKVGEKAHSKAITILIHYGLKDQDYVYQAILDEALDKKELSPIPYAYMIDCQNVRYGRTQLYCQYNTCQYETLSKEEKTKVLENRKSIGLLIDTYYCGGKRDY